MWHQSSLQVNFEWYSVIQITVGRSRLYSAPAIANYRSTLFKETCVPTPTGNGCSTIVPALGGRL